MNRFTPLILGSGLKLKNRVVVPPMASGTASESGFVSEKTIEHYSNLSKSKAAILFVEYTFIDQTGKSEPNQLGIASDDQISGLSRLRKEIKNFGAIPGIQITHAGGKSSSEITGEKLWSPSGVAVPSLRGNFETPREISKKEIKELQEMFLSATKRAVKAGFRIVEFHSAHGYGINQWLSHVTNRRKDEYGGSYENRARILFEILEEVIKQFPETLFACRIPGLDHFENGITIEESKRLAKDLEKIGIALIDVSSGMGGWRRPRERRGQGYLVPDAIEIQKVVNIPVIGVGGIVQGSFIDCLISKNKISLAAVGRAILENPLKWGSEKFGL